MPRQPDPLAFANRVQRMEPGQTIYFPLDDYARASIHVSLSRLRREYRDLIGGDLLPAWSLDIPTPPGDLWAVTYHGLTEGGRIPRQTTTTTPQERRERRNITQRIYRNRLAQERLLRLLERSQNDPTLRADAPLGYESVTQEDVDAVRLTKRELTDKQLAHLAELRKTRSAKAQQRRIEREAKQAQEANAEKAQKPLSLPEVLARLEQIDAACEHYEEREDQVRAQLQMARDAQAKAKPLHLLSEAQHARVASGLAKSRYDRAGERIEYYRRRLKHYQDRIDQLDQEREALKEAREDLLALQDL